jgi:Tc toxin complex TcA C-terminal TcB-binding domain
MIHDRASPVFHGAIDKFHFGFDRDRRGFEEDTTTETAHTVHRVIRERDLTYRFYPHFHPYVGDLTRRLLRGSVRGLQAADTDYLADGPALPDSVEVTLAAGASQSVSSGTPIVLNPNVQATLPAGGVIDLSDGLQVDLAAAATATLSGPLSVTLREGLADLPSPGDDHTFTAVANAVVVFDAEATFAAATAITLYDGSQATLPAGTSVLIPRATPLTVPAGTRVKFVRSRRRPTLFGEIFSSVRYNPSPTMVTAPYPVKDLDFTYSGAYSAYNWELFFHVPFTIAIHLSKNQRFAEAQQWLHYIFDPTDDSDDPTPERFWKVRPFHSTDGRKIEEIMVNLATGSDPELRDETILSIEAWKDAPFRPHVIARFRQQAYMYKAVMVYLDNLIAWGDSLFRQDTGEAVDEALMIYVMAANILGPRPQAVPRKGSIQLQTYANLRQDLDKFGNAMRDLEPEVPFDLMPFPAAGAPEEERLATLRSLGKALYFGVPRNDKLLTYWDTVADRLFKIHNSLNIQGVFRRLALFEPPIDPAMLARATAAGLDVGAIINGLNQPLPLVRFQVLIQKALELVQEAKSLGQSLLSAMEKEEGEALGLLRAKHERAVLSMVEQVKYAQVQEATKSREGLVESLALAVQRYTFNERQLGTSAEEIEKAIPQLVELDRAALEKMKFSQDEPAVPPRDIEVDIAQDLGASGGRIVSSYEEESLSKSQAARTIQDTVKGLNLLAQGLALIPDFGIDLHFWGLGGNSDIIGGKKLSDVAKFSGDVANAVADRLMYESDRASKIGSYARREQDWAFQSALAAGEISQVYKQIRAAEIRQAVAEYELRNHRLQMKQSEEIELFLNGEGTMKKGKVTNKALYAWMKRETKGLYNQVFHFAFDTARQAERALQHELGDPAARFLGYEYLGGKEGLLAGEKLYLDVKRMETAYVTELNRRELELTKSVSVTQVDPLALVQLRETGSCTMRIPEVVFDLDGPGHYFRRIKSVEVSIPSVIGPYSSVNCTLTLQKSSIRKSPVLGDQYARIDAEDPRFDDSFASLQSIVTSSAERDSGLFEMNLRDDRYLPFEHHGVVSEWRIELPANPGAGDPRTFDYSTISDLIIHFRYTARHAGDPLRAAAKGNVKELMSLADGPGSVRLFSVRHEFPNEWAKFLGQTPAANQRYELAITLAPEHYPFWSQGRLSKVDAVSLLARPTNGAGSINVFETVDDVGTPAMPDVLQKDAPTYGELLFGSLTNVALPPSPTQDVKLYFADKKLDDLWIAVKWSG